MCQINKYMLCTLKFQPRLLEALLMAQLGKVYSKKVCIDYPQLDEE